MAYSYFLVSYAKGTTGEYSTNVYAASASAAATVGAVLLTKFYGISIPVASVVVEEVTALTSDSLTTT